MSTRDGDRSPPVEASRHDGWLRRLHRRWQPGPWTGEASALTLVTALLVVLGLVMSFSASFVPAAEAGDAFAILRRQLVWAAIGIPAFWLAAGLDHRVWRRLSWPLLAIAVIALLLVLIPGVGAER
ncbi:MAG: FtsW/RodA/SpoVE family cell cycle protein, partial [Nitriliruptoraceae bacterium]